MKYTVDPTGTTVSRWNLVEHRMRASRRKLTDFMKEKEKLASLALLCASNEAALVNQTKAVYAAYDKYLASYLRMNEAYADAVGSYWTNFRDVFDSKDADRLAQEIQLPNPSNFFKELRLERGGELDLQMRNSYKKIGEEAAKADRNLGRAITVAKVVETTSTTIQIVSGGGMVIVASKELLKKGGIKLLCRAGAKKMLASGILYAAHSQIEGLLIAAGVDPQMASAGLLVVQLIIARIPGACFPEGTPVWTEDGAVPIEEIQEGDKVWSCNVETGEWELNEVTATFVRDYRHGRYNSSIRQWPN